MNPSQESSPVVKPQKRENIASVDALNKFMSPEGKKLDFTKQNIIQEDSHENVILLVNYRKIYKLRGERILL